MKNVVALLCSIALLAAVGFGLSSCKDDDSPSRPKLSFAETERSVNEDAGTIDVELVLNKAHSKDLRIEYELGGTAQDQDVVGTASADYEVVGTHGVVDIEAGETKGIIKLKIYADAGFEPDETIEIAIIDTNTDEIELTEDDEMVITILNDDEQITASFAATTMTVNESDGDSEEYLKVNVQLDKAPSQDVKVTYTLGGTALDSLTASIEDEPLSDYYIHGVVGELIVPAGQTSAAIEIQLFTDFVFEDDETIEITLTESNDVKVGTNKTMTITVEQQNGKVIALFWENAAYTDVDMDLFLWAGPSYDELQVLTLSANAGATPKLELVFIPTQVTGGYFGLSHNYYQGSADPMSFEVHFIDYVDGVIEGVGTREVFEATYTAANKFKWDVEQQWPAVVQTFRILNSQYTDITEISVPASGSRLRVPAWKDGFAKSKRFIHRPLIRK